MQITEEALRDLSLLNQETKTVLSVYMPFKGKLEDMKKAVEKGISDLKDNLTEDETAYLDLTKEQLIDYLREKVESRFEGPGIAFFSDFDSDFVRGYRMYTEPEPFFIVDREAHITRLALELDQYEPIGVIMLDGSLARILVTAGDVLDEHEDIKVKIHHLSKVGGWSQMRYQRRRDKEIKHFAKDVAEKAEKIFDSENIRRVIIAGRERLRVALKEEFHQRFNIIGEVDWDLAMRDEKFQEKIESMVEGAEIAEEKDILTAFNAEMKKKGLAEAGFENVLKALHIGQVEILIIGKGVDQKRQERLVSLAESTSAHAEFTELPCPVLDRHEGIGAILRYRIR